MPRSRQSQFEQQRDELLLRPVMQITLEPTAFGVERRDESLPRLAEIRDAARQLRLQPFVLDREPGRTGDGVTEFVVIEETGAMGEQRERRPFRPDGDRGVPHPLLAARARIRRRPSRRIDDTIGEGNTRLESVVVHDRGEFVTQPAQARALPRGPRRGGPIAGAQFRPGRSPTSRRPRRR